MPRSHSCFPYRQIHLDFHTSGEIPGIGSQFQPEAFQRTLQKAAVNAITCFSLCHHGYSYHPTEIGVMHPHLDFDLLRAQIDAAHAVGIRVPVYLSAGSNEIAAEAHPDWREIRPNGIGGWGISGDDKPGFHKLCFNTPYLNYLCALIDETVRRYPDGDGIFLDIVIQSQCVCPKCTGDMRNLGMDPDREQDRIAFARQVLQNYYERTTAAARKYNPAMPVFHNSGNVSPGQPERLPYFSHLELESLPTGGWGYDHFPLSAAFARTTGKAFSGMTGKFQETWGEFGGFKHPNALRYECCAMLAFGARCSIVDQLHPTGKLDESTYELIGQAYREVEQKESFCRNAVHLAEIALLTAESTGGSWQDRDADIGASRLLLEGHFLFDCPLPTADWSRYPVLLISDRVRLSPELKAKIRSYRGKIITSGRIVAQLDLQCGATFEGCGDLTPTYVLPAPEFRPAWLTTPFVVYAECTKLNRLPGTRSLGLLYEPYFNRAGRHFCSHKQTPNRPEPMPFAAGVLTDRTLIFAQDVFTVYRSHGAAVFRQFITSAMETLIREDRILHTDLPSGGRATVTLDREAERYIVHLLYAPIVTRGTATQMIEELLPIGPVTVTLHVPDTVRSVRLEPEGKVLPFTVNASGISVIIERFTAHQMVAFYLKGE